MKKIVIAAIAVLALAACQKKETIETPVQEQHLSLNLTINNPSDTKAVKTAWEDGDIILVVFDKDRTDAYKHLELTYNGTSWDAVWTPGLETELIGRGSGKLSALFVPNAVDYENHLTDTYGVVYKPKDSNGNAVYSYSLKTDGADYSITGSTLTATLTMVRNDNEGPYVHFFIDGLSGTNYTLSADNNEIWTVWFGRFYYYTSKDYLTVLSCEYTFVIPGYPIGTGVEFTCMPNNPDTETSYVFTLTDTALSKSYQYDAGNKTLSGGESIVLPALSNWTPLP